MKQHEGWGDRTDGSCFLREGQRKDALMRKGFQDPQGLSIMLW